MSPERPLDVGSETQRGGGDKKHSGCPQLRRHDSKCKRKALS